LSSSIASLSSAPVALFVCQLNISSSIMAEAILRHHAAGRVRAASAGEIVSRPVSRSALQCLLDNGVSTQGLQTRRWGEFFGAGRPSVRFLIALADVYAASAAWPAETLISRWHVADPAAATGSEREIRDAFRETFRTLTSRVQKLLALPFERLDDQSLKEEIDRIGEP
jgi:arsenate reductase (thioredoxin)